MGSNSNGKFRWSRRPSHQQFPSSFEQQEIETPKEFRCPISNSLMADPVVVSSGHSFDSFSVQVCNELGFSPTLSDGSVPDFSITIVNINMKSTILNWCRKFGIELPETPDRSSLERNVRTLMERERPEPRLSSSLSSSSSSEIIGNEEIEQLVWNLGSLDVLEQEDAVISLREITRKNEEARISLCTPNLLSALKSLISSAYSAVKVNAMAALTNLSLQKQNKIKIVRAGIVPLLIDALVSGSSESQEHAAGALFSLAMEDDNKFAIGTLGALPPLMSALQSDSEPTRHDSAFCLYHLTKNQTNRVKLVKLNAVPNLLSMLRLRDSASRALLILCNLAACNEGRSAMLDANAVAYMVWMLREDDFESESTQENCLTVLYGLSQGGFRYKGLAKEANAAEVLRAVEERGAEKLSEKAKRMLQMLKGIDEVDNDERPNYMRGGINFQPLSYT